MNKKLLCAALLAGLGGAQAASAQEFDDRWYVTGSVGFNFQDDDRRTSNAPFGTLGLGKFVSPNWSLDGELNYQNANFDDSSLCAAGGVCRAQDLNWSQYGISLDARRHFMTEGRNWNPYGLIGLGYQREEIELNNFPNRNSPFEDKVSGGALKLGAGLQGDIGRVKIRTELAYRAGNAINDTRAALAVDDPRPERNDGPDWFGDVLASVGVVIPLGPAPMAPAPAAPPPPPPVERCPPARPGQVVGPDGCPVDVTIDLRGVNFDFDRATLRPDAVNTLREAADILRRYPDLRVEVAGHTDLCGSEVYNQGLSERRASAVYDYLTSNGVDSGRLAGPIGYGESRPLESTPQTLPACRSETNRRTELNVQN